MATRRSSTGGVDPLLHEPLHVLPLFVHVVIVELPEDALSDLIFEYAKKVRPRHGADQPPFLRHREKPLIAADDDLLHPLYGIGGPDGGEIGNHVLLYGKLLQLVKDRLLDDLPGDDARHPIAGRDGQGIDIILGQDAPAPRIGARPGRRRRRERT